MGDSAGGGSRGSGNEIETVVIVGGGTAGWMAAAAFSRFLNNGRRRIALVESDAIGIVGVGEATIPPIQSFNQILDINENEFLRATRGTFKAGIEFVNWGRVGDRYFHPFGVYGHDLHGIPFHQLWLRETMNGGNPGDIGQYCMSGAASALRRFARPGPAAKLPLSQLFYAFHFDASLYAKFLRGIAERQGVERREGKIVKVHRDGESGDVLSVELEGGERIEGDLFIDCSGFRSQLIGKELGVGWEDWRHWLPCDRALAIGCDHSEAEVTPYTRAIARRGGWQWRIPLQHRIGNGYIFSSDHVSNDDAHALLMANLDGAPHGEPRMLRFSPGRRTSAWQSNCVAIGLSSGFLEPLESTSIFLIQAAVVDLIDLIPRPGPIDPRLASEFNRLTALQYERVRDFLILHYAANRRAGEPMWDHLRSMPVPDSLTHKVELFRARASAPDYQLGLFSRDSWLSVLFGQGIKPGGHDPLAETFQLDQVESKCSDFERRINSVVETMPKHHEFIARYCAAPRSEAA